MPPGYHVRASVARTRAAGARRGRSADSVTSPPPRTRSRRRWWPRRYNGRARAFPSNPARLADPGRRPPHDGPHPQRSGPPAPRRPTAARAVRRSMHRTERFSDDVDEDDTLDSAVHVLPSVSDFIFGDRTDAARRGRIDYCARSPMRSWFRKPRWRSGSAAQSRRIKAPACHSGCPRSQSERNDCAPCSTCFT